jgi:CRP-like cAMP-binding protein
MEGVVVNRGSADRCDALFRRLARFTRLSDTDREVLSLAASRHVRTFAARDDLIREGDRPTAVFLVLEGWACRYKHLEDGRRQIVGFFLPGDLCDLNIFILREMDHSIGAITPVVAGEIGREAFEGILADRPRITQALWWDTLVTVAIQREWTVNLGQREALERTAHLLCELFLRLRVAGLASGTSCEFPVTQADLADAIGLSPVHVNRTLQKLRVAGLISLSGRTLTIHDLEELKRVALFSANYLHLDRDGAHLDAGETQRAAVGAAGPGAPEAG